MAISEEDGIIELSSDEYKTIVFVTKSTIRVLSGARKRIQDETQTTITYSKVKSEGFSKRVVEVKGTSHGDVYAARQQIKSFENVGPKRKLPTHFTCVKVTNSTILENYLKFKEGILNVETSPAIHDSIFMRPEKLHLTLGVMCLTEDENCQQAKQLLTDCLQNTVEPIKSEYGKIEMNIRGVDIMKGSPNNAKVVYAKIESESLQKIANGIAQSFIDSCLAKKENGHNNVRMHMTLLNIKYLKKAKNNKSFDAKFILEQYADFEFGSQEVNQIHLALMSQKDADGFYKCIASIEF